MVARILVGSAASSIAAITLLCLPGLTIGGPLTDPGGGDEQRVTVTPPGAKKATPLREASPRLAVPGATPYLPPLHGTNPHGQGTVGTIDLTPSPTRPLSEDPTGEADPTPNREEIIVGRARGEQRADGRYHGHITILSLFGNEIAGVDTNPGETRDGPLDPIQTQLLNPICMSSGGAICLQLLRAHSATTATSSTNEFRAAQVRLGGTQAGGAGLNADAAESHGNIASDGTCQNAHGDSEVTGVTIGAGANVLPQIQAAESTSDSRACRGQAPTQTNTSDVITPDIGIPPLVPTGCGSGGPGNQGTPNTVGGLPTLLPLVCNADTSNGSQATAPYGVREALAVFALVTPPDSALLKVTAAASESHAVAPAAPTDPGPGPGPTGPGVNTDDAGGGGGGDDDDDDDGTRDDDAGGGGDEGGGGDDGGGAGDSGAGGDDTPECIDGIDNDGDGKIDFPNDPQCESRSDDSEADGALAFTGVDLLLIALSGAIMLVAGLSLRSLVSRKSQLA